MPKETKIITQEMVTVAEKELNKLKEIGRIAIRLKAIIASSKHGIKKVAEVYDISRGSMHRWIGLFRDHGVDGLKNEKKPARSKLKAEQKKEIKELIEAESGITIKKIKIVIKERFDIDMEKSSIHKMMTDMGFRHITGRKKHYKSDDSLKKEFKKKSRGAE